MGELHSSAYKPSWRDAANELVWLQARRGGRARIVLEPDVREGERTCLTVWVRWMKPGNEDETAWQRGIMRHWPSGEAETVPELVRLMVRLLDKMMEEEEKQRRRAGEPQLGSTKAGW